MTGRPGEPDVGVVGATVPGPAGPVVPSRPGMPVDRRAPWVDQRELRRTTPPGRRALLLVALVIGVLMLGLQLWLLTVALDLYLGGHGGDVWSLALVSGLIFAGGAAANRVFGRQPRAG